MTFFQDFNKLPRNSLERLMNYEYGFVILPSQEGKNAHDLYSGEWKQKIINPKYPMARLYSFKVVNVLQFSDLDLECVGREHVKYSGFKSLKNWMLHSRKAYPKNKNEMWSLFYVQLSCIG